MPKDDANKKAELEAMETEDLLNVLEDPKTPFHENYEIIALLKKRFEDWDRLKLIALGSMTKMPDLRVAIMKILHDRDISTESEKESHDIEMFIDTMLDDPFGMVHDFAEKFRSTRSNKS